MKSTAVLQLGLEVARRGRAPPPRPSRRARRRLVEDQQRRILRERHRDHDPLLHPARELMRIAAHHASRDRRSAPAPSASRARSSASLPGDAEHGERLRDLRADPHARVQRRAGVLVDHRHRAGVVLAQPARPRARARPARRPRCCRRRCGRCAAGSGRSPSAAVDLPQPDSPTSPYDSPALDRERHAAQDGAVDPADAVDELEVGDVQRGGVRRLRSPLVHLPDPVRDEVDRRRRGWRSRAPGTASSTSTGRSASSTG